uniref:Ral GTPase activating protein catalytic subunit alpha 2 n=1 Tax=Oryzias sinensis TaxID=183150 RepID=A0A8C7XD37_9TELE
MFTRRGHGDVKKSTQKVLDQKKDVLTRLKHLRALIDINDKTELKAFFEGNCSQIYFIFYENFITLESNLKQKGNKSQREELDSILFIFEKILQLLPEKIYNRWQFHSIALRDNCAEEQFLIFACLVPGFPAVPSSRGPCTLDTIIYNPYSTASDEEITPLVPAVAGEKASDDPTCYILETLLKYMVIQASSLEWRIKEHQDSGFRFLFSLFKKYYLPHLFPSFSKLTNLYKPLLELPHYRPKPLYVPVTRNNESTFCTRDQYLAPRVAFINWLVTFFLEKKYVSCAAAAQSTKNGTEVIPKLIQVNTAVSFRYKEKDADSNGPVGEPEKSHSNSSTLSDRRPSDSSLCSIEEEHRQVYEMVHSLLLSTRDNVNFVNEIFHQAFLLPSCEASATRKVIKVYRKWILEEKPNFMAEPDTTIQGDEVDDHPQQILSSETNHELIQVNIQKSSTWGRTYSFSSAISRGFLTEEQNMDVNAGIQPTLQVFLTNSSNVFLLEPCQDVPKLLENQVEVCKGVLSIYRHMIMEHTMTTQTWLVQRHTSSVFMTLSYSSGKTFFGQMKPKSTSTGMMAGEKDGEGTIIVAWVRANLSVFISRELWDELLVVLSSLTCWEELITEWASIMDSLTAVLARSVYGLDMANLPLDKLSEQKEKKQRGRGVIQDSQKATAVARSFSLSWRNQGEQGGPGFQEPMRIRSATTSGAPGVENARNIVRQKINIVIINSSAGKHSEYRRVDVCPCDHFPVTSSRLRAIFVLSSLLMKRCSKPRCPSHPCLVICVSVCVHCDHLYCAPFLKPSFILSLPMSFLGSGCAFPPHSAPPYHNHNFHYPQNPPSSPSLLVHTECPPDYPLDDTIHHSVLHMPHHLDSSECLADDVSIIAGGTLTGWHPDSAFVLWRRILGILGDVNNISCPKIHAKVFAYLYELWHKLAKIRDNLGISVDNQSSPPQPAFIPPLRMFGSWLFRATVLPSEYKAGKLQAYRLICEMITRHQDVLPSSDFSVHLFNVMHKGFTSDDQDVLNTLIHSCSPRFFFLGLPGFTMLIGDFINAAACAPRIKAQTILGSLVCFPNLYRQIPILLPSSNDINIGNMDIKVNDQEIILLEAATKEPCEGARCIAVCSLGLWVCEELTQKSIHHQVKDAINVLGVTLKVCNLQTHCFCLFVLSLNFHFLVFICQLLVSLLLCLLDWCIAIPLSLLLETITIRSVGDHTSQNLYFKKHFFPHNQPCFTLSLMRFPSDIVPTFQSLCFPFLLTEKRRRNMELIPLTARMVMTHLVNHLGHHPLSGGPALLHSLVSENHDNPYVESSELSSEVFKSPNLQLCVFNDSTLVSYLQIPAETNTVGQPPHPSSQVRVIVRDISGKYSWDGTILYCTTQEDCDVGAFYAADHSFSTTASTHSKNLHFSPIQGPSKNHCSALDSLSNCSEEDEVDALDKLLEDLSHSSPECLSQPQVRLNQPAPSPHGMNSEQEKAIQDAIVHQTQQEEEQVRRWDADISFRADCQQKPIHQEPKSPFYFCRLLLNDLGMNSWDRRKSFHLLKKNSKLLRELKNLDSRQCRETHKIAVFYIGEGQEDKCSILSNNAGSQAYEDFVSGLGWEVDLATHCGFMGGLQRNGSTGLTAPYYATSTVEVIFHVSTRMPSDSDDSITKKLRHLGNDEVHIVWSEHTRDYRRGIIPTDFGDVLINIYPMKNNMYFIQIMQKVQVPFFGPLFNGAIVSGILLPSLVRATCINASRAIKSRLPLYQSFYEERALYLEAIVQNHREVMTFEDFASQVFSPSPGYPVSGTDLVSSRGPTDFKHTAFSTSSSPSLYFVHLLFFQAAYFHAITFA